MKKWMKEAIGYSMALMIGISSVGCQLKEVNAEEMDVVNIGVTNSLGGMNPLCIDQTEINAHAVGLMFLPLVELDNDLNFQAMLAESVETEDQIVGIAKAVKAAGATILRGGSFKPRTSV